MVIQVREATPDDAAAIIAILNPIIESGRYTVFDTPLSADEERRYIENLPSRGVFNVAWRHPDRRIVGFQSLEPFATYTHAFDHVGVLATFVDQKYRRQGVATLLFKATFEAAKKRSYEKIFTFVRADNPTALAAYLKQGFSIVGTARRQAKIDGRYVDEVIIERFL